MREVKTFLRILPLLLCLFGYHLAGAGYSAPIQLQRTSCPSLPVLLLIVINPQHLTALVTVVGIPLYRLVIIKIFSKISNAHQNVGGSIPLTTASCTVYHSGCQL